MHKTQLFIRYKYDSKNDIIWNIGCRSVSWEIFNKLVGNVDFLQFLMDKVPDVAADRIVVEYNLRYGYVCWIELSKWIDTDNGYKYYTINIKTPFWWDCMPEPESKRTIKGLTFLPDNQSSWDEIIVLIRQNEQKSIFHKIIDSLKNMWGNIR